MCTDPLVLRVATETNPNFLEDGSHLRPLRGEVCEAPHGSRLSSSPQLGALMMRVSSRQADGTHARAARSGWRTPMTQPGHGSQGHQEKVPPTVAACVLEGWQTARVGFGALSPRCCCRRRRPAAVYHAGQSSLSHHHRYSHRSFHLSKSRLCRCYDCCLLRRRIGERQVWLHHRYYLPTSTTHCCCFHHRRRS